MLAFCWHYMGTGNGDNLMAALRVRRLDDSVVRRLKARAAAHDRSVEGEVRHILKSALENDMAAKRRVFLARIRQLQKEITLQRPHTPREVLIREDRDRNHGR